MMACLSHPRGQSTQMRQVLSLVQEYLTETKHAFSISRH